MALSPGTEAPDFTLADITKQPVSLSSFRGKKVVLVFYPAAFTGVCKAEVCSFQGAIQRLNTANAQVIGVSADTPFANGAFAAENGLEFPLLSDFNLDTIRAYDVIFHNFAGLQGLTRSERATFVIDEAGVIRHVYVTANPGVEPNYDEIFADVDAMS